jgi:hypothetical protein
MNADLAIENAALKAECAQQKERIAFLERTVTQMIHTSYNVGSNGTFAPSAQDARAASAMECGDSAPLSLSQAEIDQLVTERDRLRDAIIEHRECIQGADYDYDADETYKPEADLYRALKEHKRKKTVPGGKSAIRNPQSAIAP